MTTEAEARARLLAHYEDKIAMLKRLVEELAGGMALMTDAADKRACLVRITARETEIAKVERDAARLRDTIAGR